MKKISTINPALVLLIGVISVSSASIFVRFAQINVPSLVIATYRMTFATLLIIPFSLKAVKNEWHKLSRGKIILLVFSGFFLALHFASWIKSLELTNVASSVVLVTSTPLWVSIFSPLVLREKIPLRAILSLLIAFGGTILISLGGNCKWINLFHGWCDFSFSNVESEFVGNVLALLGALFATCYVIIGRSVRKTLSLASYAFWVYGIAAVFLLLITIVRGKPLLGYSTINYFWFLLLALIPQAIGHSCFNWALGVLPTFYVSITLLGEPIGSSLLAYLFLGEKPMNIEITGGVLILIGIFFASLKQNFMKRTY